MATREDQALNRLVLTAFVVMATTLGVLWYWLHVMYQQGQL